MIKRGNVNDQLLSSYWVSLCETLLAIRKSREWRDWHETWDEYVTLRWSMSKSRAKLLCDFASLREMCHVELFGTLPETPDAVKPLLALPRKQWLEVWELVVNYCKHPITASAVEATMQHFHIYANKKLSPEALKAIRVRRAAKVMAEMHDGEKLVSEIGGRALGKNWGKAVEVVISADQARLNEQAR